MDKSKLKEVLSFLDEGLYQYVFTKICALGGYTLFELRIRNKNPVSVVTNKGIVLLGERVVSSDEIERSYMRLLNYSLHSYKNEIRNGYITLPSGCRVGFFGTAVLSDTGAVESLRDISGFNLRFAADIDADGKRITKDDFKGLLIIGPPNCGKTTLLRDVIKNLSIKGKKVSVIDERGEIAFDGNLNLGVNVDLLNGYPKNEGIILATRTLSPNYIACDEIGSQREAEEIFFATVCGASFIATVHAGNFKEAMQKEGIANLVKAGCFDTFAVLSKPGERFELFVEDGG